ncbi:hypothetical protein [Palleronia caenipelagi]|uniref:Glutamine amidotransferase domain-containing protein n=1 Tax=Palleronia caenipelagi TaxID=2489174 RepID=A0A547Q2N8_9RHOB|nr:hypothetical protein [Palleronia caenipelagi]TRD20650.1 hypothetical protein FEV53_09865 [Palleronia caenipelagi]
MADAVIFDPMLPWPVIAGLGVLALILVALALWRGLPGWGLRGLAALVLLTALSGPSLVDEARDPLGDILIAVVDDSASQVLSDRPDQTDAALARLEAQVAALPDTELRVVRVGDSPDNAGSLVMTALTEALAEAPAARIAGAVVISDGQIHDMERAPAMTAPLHLLRTGRDSDWDRRLVITTAPAFAILGEEVAVRLKVEDQGRAPRGLDSVPLDIAVDGGEPRRFTVPLGQEMELPVRLPHAGQNIIQISTPVAEGELTDRNNAAVVQMNGVRDRLRVLLVSGEPHPGERTWRNLLKSDASVDLVHFTILRPPEKQDGVPVSELSLIAFPTRELFLEKIDEFDLIIFDRYKLRGILPALYLDNVRRYVESGGAVLVAAGPDFASAASLYRSQLRPILPGAPTARVLEEPYLPRLTETGERHPVTRGLGRATAESDPDWGRWLRQVELEATGGGQVVMTGADDGPLLILGRFGQGRSALLGSDQAWLWSRGFEGGGPQLDLLRRVAHWAMQEPELEEEALSLASDQTGLRITRRTLGDSIGSAEVTAPDGTVATVTLEQIAPGLFETVLPAEDPGLYRVTEGEREAVIALGPRAPREFEETVATGVLMAPVIDAVRGGIVVLEDGVPRLRAVREGQPAAGRGWIGYMPRGAYLTVDQTTTPLLPGWVWLILAAGLAIGGWLREGR